MAKNHKGNTQNPSVNPETNIDDRVVSPEGDDVINTEAEASETNSTNVEEPEVQEKDVEVEKQDVAEATPETETTESVVTEEPKVEEPAQAAPVVEETQSNEEVEKTGDYNKGTFVEIVAKDLTTAQRKLYKHNIEASVVGDKLLAGPVDAGRVKRVVNIALALGFKATVVEK